MYTVIKKLKMLFVLSLIYTPIHATPSTTAVNALEVLNQWNETLGQKNLLLHDMKFDSEFLEFKELNTFLWVKREEKIDEKDRFFKFATDKDGGKYYLWFYPTLKGEPPVVTIDMSDKSAANVTENMEDFVCSLIGGEALGGENMYSPKSNDFEKVDEYKKKFLATLTCPKKVEVFPYETKHPKINEWLDALDEKYELKDK